MARVPPVLYVMVIAYVAKFLYDRATVLGAFRSPTTFHTSSEIKIIPDTINAEDLHYDDASGLIFTSAQGVDNTRHLWFPPLLRFSDPEAATRADGGLRVIDPEVRTLQIPKLTLDLHIQAPQTRWLLRTIRNSRYRHHPRPQARGRNLHPRCKPRPQPAVHQDAGCVHC